MIQCHRPRSGRHRACWFSASWIRFAGARSSIVAAWGVRHHGTVRTQAQCHPLFLPLLWQAHQDHCQKSGWSPAARSRIFSLHKPQGTPRIRRSQRRWLNARYNLRSQDGRPRAPDRRPARPQFSESAATPRHRVASAGATCTAPSSRWSSSSTGSGITGGRHNRCDRRILGVPCGL